MDNTKLQEIIESHGKWLRGEEGGRRANLRGANLRGADLCGANLCGANLFGANLFDANLRGATLRIADLCDADLRNATLCDADLRDADLRNANLCNVNLCGANLCGADLSRKIIQVGPIGSRQSYTIYRVDENIVQCGCWHGEGREPWKGGTLEEFEERVIVAYPLDTQHGKDYRAVVEYFKTLKVEVGSHE